MRTCNVGVDQTTLNPGFASVDTDQEHNEGRKPERLTISKNASNTLSNMKQKALNTRQRKFVKLIAQGETQAQAHKKAGFNNTTIEGHGANAIRLLKNERIQEELQKLKDKVTQKTVLSVEAKRRFLHDIVHANPLDPDLPGHLIQEARTEVDQSGNVKKVIKLPSKLEAINLDNKMTQVYETRDDKETNPFLAIISLFSNSPGLPAALPATPVIEAEIVP